MKTKITFAIIMLSFGHLSSFGQATVPGNIPAGGAFLGWNDNLNTQLDIRQNNIQRMTFSSVNWPGYNNIGGVNNTNRIFLPVAPFVTQTDVFSILQLGEEINTNLKRDWMNTGITIGADGNDIFWSGIIPDPLDDGSQTGGDAAIAWGDNAGQFGPDNFRFLFISNLTAATSGANSDQGLETMRITPNGNVGIGDFSSAGLAQQPTHSLDVDGGGRFRQLPLNNSPDVFITGRVANGAGDYVLTYTPFSNLNASDCRWKDTNSGTNPGEQDLLYCI